MCNRPCRGVPVDHSSVRSYGVIGVTSPSSLFFDLLFIYPFLFIFPCRINVFILFQLTYLLIIYYFSYFSLCSHSLEKISGKMDEILKNKCKK